MVPGEEETFGLYHKGMGLKARGDLVGLGLEDMNKVGDGIKEGIAW